VSVLYRIPNYIFKFEALIVAQSKNGTEFATGVVEQKKQQEIHGREREH